VTTILEIVFYSCIAFAFVESMFASLFIIIGIKDSGTKATRNILHAVAYALLALAVATWK